MYCKNCGIQIDDDSNFCFHCGTKSISNNTNINASHKTPELNTTLNVNLSFGRQREKELTPPKPESNKYDSTYKRETNAFIFSICYIPIYLIIFGLIKDFNSQVLIGVSLLLFIVRVTLLFWCFNIAKRQNRNASAWALMAFFIPGISLLMLGMSKKLNLENINKEQQLDNNYKIKLDDGRILTVGSEMQSGYTFGDQVFIDGNKAQDGTYKIGFMDYMSVKDGKITV